MSGLDEHGRRILRFIERYQNHYGRTPSYEEIRVEIGLRSKNHVYRDVKTLEHMGYLHREKGISRGITLLRTADGYVVTPHSVSIPVLGHTLIESLPRVDDGGAPTDWIELTRAMLPDSEGVFAVRVNGDSMIDALVNDGDTVVMTRQDTACNGELVAVKIRNDPTNTGLTLKRYYRRNGHVWLKPENPALRARKYPTHDVHVEGKVLCVIRNIPAYRAPQ